MTNTPIQNLDLKPFSIRRPERVRWFYDLSAPDLISTIQSKTLTKLLRNVDEVLEKYEVTVKHQILDEQDYRNWWQHYTDVMTQKRYDIIATEEWFSLKMAEHKKVGGFFFYHEGKLKGTILYTQKGDSIIATFKTSQEVPGLTKKHRSLGAIIDYIFLRTMLKEKPTFFSLGSMRNAFGVINTLGNLEYKLNMGYIPQSREDTPFLDEVPLNEQGRVVFFGQKGNQFQLFCIKSSDDPEHFEVERFESARIPVSVITYKK